MGEIDEAKKLIQDFKPEAVLQQHAKAIEFGTTTKGKKGLLFSMGVRWLPHFISLKQIVGLEDIRINFDNTSHEELAQKPGKATYFIDSDNIYWKVLGEKETGKTIISNSVNPIEYDELFMKGILLDTKTKIKVNPISGTEKLIAGEYNLKFLLASEDNIAELRVDINGSTNEILINKTAIEEIYIVLDGKANPVIEFISQKGKPILCGLVQERKK